MIILFTLLIVAISVGFTLYIFSRDDDYNPGNQSIVEASDAESAYVESDDDAEPAYIIDDDVNGKDKTIILITGGAGVLGWRIASMCKNRFPSETTEVTVLDVNKPKEHRKVDGVNYICGDLTEEVDVICAFAKVFTHPKPCKNIVFHVAGLLPSVSTTPETLEKVNVAGTKKLVGYCKNYCVDILISTSSASVVLPSDNLFVNGLNSQTLPYPEDSNYVDMYAKSKAKGEQYVLEANGSNHQTSPDDVLNTKLATVCIRPSIIYACDDSKFGERLLRDEINYVFDQGQNIIDFGWADNIALGHVQCCEYMLNSSKNSVYHNSNAAAGKAFHLGQGRGISTKEFYGLKEWGNGKPLSIPLFIMKFLAAFNYYFYQYFGVAPIDPFLRPDSLNFMAGRTWWFNIDNAKNTFGYNPVSIEDSILIMKYKQMNEWGIQGRVSQEALHLHISQNF